MRAVSAKTTYPNTPESDLQGLVCHTVTLDNGLKVRIYAKCPISAINLINDNIDKQVTMVLE